MPHPSTMLPVLIPSVTVHAIFEIECIDESRPADPITIAVLNSDTQTDTPLVASTLIMPQSETLE